MTDSRAALEERAKNFCLQNGYTLVAKIACVEFAEQESSSLKLLLGAICADKVDLVRFPQPLLLFYGEPRKILSFELDSSGIPVITEEILKALEATK